jgi:1-deoxy-D-xylulose-5-phosphate reductoisomerase
LRSWAYGLGYPERIEAGVAPLDFAKVGKLEFEPLDLVRFPCVRLAFEAMQRSETAPAILNAANEIAVESFLNNELAFVDIPAVIEDVLSRATITPADSLQSVLDADALGRDLARELIRARVAQKSSLKRAS